MSTLPPAKLAAVRAMVEMVPDETIIGLTRALASTPSFGPLGAVKALIEAESYERAVRNTVLAPVAGLCRTGRRVGKLTFPPRVMRRMWSGLKMNSPRLVAEATLACERMDPEMPPPPVLDALCAVAGAGLRERMQLDFRAAAEACDASVAAGADAMAGCLDLAPVVRSALPHLDGWVGRMNEERATVGRLAFSDAVAIAPDAGPKFVEMLASRLDEPWLTLRLVSMVMDRPAERYLAESEMAGFAEDILADIDNQIATVQAFTPAAGSSTARAAGRAVHEAILASIDFEDCVELSRELPWGSRLAHQKATLAKVVEAKLGGMDNLVASALPLENIRFAGRMTKLVPRLASDPDPVAVGKAESLLAFAEAVRPIASKGGFGSSRAKALEKVNERLSSYSEDLLTHLRGEDHENLERARLYLEVAAGFLALSQDEKAAQIVRRRAAA
jgi:hypothetical protein